MEIHKIKDIIFTRPLKHAFQKNSVVELLIQLFRFSGARQKKTLILS